MWFKKSSPHFMLAWEKPAPLKATGLFQAGFSATTSASGIKYVVVKTARTLVYSDLDSSKADVHLRDGGVADIDAPVAVTLADKVTADAPNTNTVNLTITRTTGLISGSFIPSAGAKAVKFYGVLHQGENCGAGFFLRTNHSGSVEVHPR